ncbi:unannotated protein [freshwater metagenome]|jgi:uncharacterized membrane protein|uniref:Unannotated protein n=1 Tax=freshwater metagenome TaxID=449393 RepID=A0A6J6CX79_9ZZZZ|nr:DUF1003 domain-containing protein [Actinomycetota bacterium]
MSQWSNHPATEKYGKSQLSFRQRSADVLRNAMGSWPFVFSALGFIALWIYFNNDGSFDPFPFILLNLILACVAALQGAILLIAAKREDQINSDLAVHTYQIDQENLELTKKVHELSLRIEKLTLEVHEAVKPKQ